MLYRVNKPKTIKRDDIINRWRNFGFNNLNIFYDILRIKMKNLPSRWKYGLVAVLAILEISSSGAATQTQTTTNKSTSIEQQVKGAKSLTVSPTKIYIQTQPTIETVAPTSS